MTTPISEIITYLRENLPAPDSPEMALLRPYLAELAEGEQDQTHMVLMPMLLTLRQVCEAHWIEPEIVINETATELRWFLTSTDLIGFPCTKTLRMIPTLPAMRTDQGAWLLIEGNKLRASDAMGAVAVARDVLRGHWLRCTLKAALNPPK